MTETGSYGRELALRAFELFRALEPEARNVMGEAPSGGSLYPTFLLSMAMPIIIQPYERFFEIDNPKKSALMVEFDGYEPNSPLAKGLDELKDMTNLSGSPFDKAKWHYAFLRGTYKLVDGISEDLERHLNNPAAAVKAQRKRPKVVLGILRHALAHGSIVYLDQEEQPSIYGPVEHFLFANSRPNGIVEFLKVNVEDFKMFITAWAKWLRDHDGRGEDLPSQ